MGGILSISDICSDRADDSSKVLSKQQSYPYPSDNGGSPTLSSVVHEELFLDQDDIF